ncbi:hypothetical protein [Promicromonospora sp. NPDC059942]|uniref:hypothetical protein n=1 Tax=Promicromonospora sp. NPDC059942 TaxID=3347009 RepID=UPI00364876B7
MAECTFWTAKLSTDALSLVATLYPVGIGLLLLELFRHKAIWSWARRVALLLLVWPAFAAILVAFGGVLGGDPMVGGYAALIRVAGCLLGVGISILLAVLTFWPRVIDTAGSADGDDESQ